MSHSIIQESDVTSLKVRLICLSENKKKQFENPILQKKRLIIDLLIDFSTTDARPSETERDEIIEDVSAQYQKPDPSFEHIRRLCYGEPYHKPSVWSFIWGLYEALIDMISSPKEMQHIFAPAKLIEKHCFLRKRPLTGRFYSSLPFFCYNRNHHDCFPGLLPQISPRTMD